jgi:endogenous inhibitor of DNA gyrase (YacG/DUF329 family)
MSQPAEGCPICGKPKSARFAPFCSRRCADIDLSRWLKGGYVIPGGPAGPQNDGNGGDPDPDEG